MIPAHIRSALTNAREIRVSVETARGNCRTEDLPEK